jgi:PAS domain S-box-containing protein
MSPDMLGTASLDGYFTHLNPAWERTLGWTAEQLMAEPLITFVHPDDAEQTLRRTKNLVSTSGTQLLSFENRCRTSTGDFRLSRHRCGDGLTRLGGLSRPFLA